MRWILFIVIGFYAIFSYGQDDEPYDYGGDDYDDCIFYKDPDPYYENDECHHAKFLNETQSIKERFGNKVQECCPNFHGYTYDRQCEVSSVFFKSIEGVNMG